MNVEELVSKTSSGELHVVLVRKFAEIRDLPESAVHMAMAEQEWPS